MTEDTFLGLNLPDFLSSPEPLEPHEQRLYDLAEAAHQSVKKKNPNPETAEKEHESIEDALSDTLQMPESVAARCDILRHFAEHIGRYSADLIWDMVNHLVSSEVQQPLPEHFTDDHFTVYREMDEAYINGKFKDSEDGDYIEEFYAITSYALTHIEDGHLILSLVNGRGLGTLKSILKVLPELKKADSRVLSDGIL